MTLVYPLKLNDEIMPIIELKSKEEHTNKSVVLKQLIYHSLEEYVLTLCQRGRISVGKAAEVLGVGVYDVQRMARERGIILTATEEQRQKSRELVEQLIKKVRKVKS